MKKTIAWIEDDISIIQDVIQPLINDGYKFTYFRSVNEVLDSIDVLRNVDMILCDLILPLGNNEAFSFDQYPGVQLIEKLRNQYKINTPVVVFTTVSNGNAHKRLRELDVSEIILKPVRPSELKKIIETVFENSKYTAKAKKAS